MHKRMDEVQKITGQLIVILWYAHSFGFCVNDLRLSNILVSDNCFNVVIQNLFTPLLVDSPPAQSQISHPFADGLIIDLKQSIENMYKIKVRPETSIEKLLERLLVPNILYTPPEKFQMKEEILKEVEELKAQNLDQESYLKQVKQII